MGFLAPWFLALGGAALVPLLIHLLRRRIGLQVEFPAARYLARAEREHSRTMRLRNLLLMLFRVLAVVLVAMAAARPIGRYLAAGAGHAPTALAIVIDNSMSTSVVEGGTSLLDQFKQTARAAIDRSTPDDRLWLVTVDGALRGGNAASMRDELERIRPFGGAGGLREAIARGAAAVEGSGLVARQVAVLTDGQRTAIPEAAQLRQGTPVLAWAPGRDAPVNRAVVSAEARPVRWTPRGTVHLRVQSPDSAIYRIALGPRTLARGSAAPAEEAAIRAAPAERGWVAGTVEIEPDELVLDNTRHFAVWIGPAPAVSVAGGAGAFLSNAVDVLRSTERVRDGSDISIASADEVTRLPALILPPTDPVRIGAANRALERIGIPWRFGAPRRESAIARGDQLPNVSVTLRYALEARGAAVAETMAVVGRDPWIVGGRGYVLLGSPVDAAATSLPITATFLPWLGDVLASRLHGDPGVLRTAAPGQRVSLPAGLEAIEGTDGRRLPITGSAIEAPGIAGTYFLIQGPRRAGALVVNPEVEESLLDRWSAGELARRLASRGSRVAETTDAWVDLAFTGAARQSLVGPLLIALLLVLAAEMAAATMGAPTTK
jgi:hypothetical protein